MKNIETEDAQNSLMRLEKLVYLNRENPSTRLKRQYHKALKKLADAKHEFDLLNDMKEQGQ